MRENHDQDHDQDQDQDQDRGQDQDRYAELFGNGYIANTDEKERLIALLRSELAQEMRNSHLVGMWRKR